MVFPGVLRGARYLDSRPPHEPTASKPVVPGDVCPPILPARRLGQGGRLTESDADPSRLRNPPRGRPEGLSHFQVARPHTSLASLFAARFRVWIQPSQGPFPMQGLRALDSASSAKKALSGHFRWARPASAVLRCYEALRHGATMNTWTIPSCRFRHRPRTACRSGLRSPRRRAGIRSASCPGTAPASARG